MSKGDWRCIACHVRNNAETIACENCGVARPEGRTAKPKKTSASTCPVDGAPLRPSDGWCEQGAGYSIARAFSPFACPVCRHPLAWSGRCLTCFGAASVQDRESWTIPGDRYEVADGHWRLVEKGPFRVCTREENQSAIALVGSVYRGELSPAMGHDLIRVLIP